MSLDEALERLVKFYETKGDEAETAKWRRALDVERSAPVAPTEPRDK